MPISRVSGTIIPQYVSDLQMLNLTSSLQTVLVPLGWLLCSFRLGLVYSAMIKGIEVINVRILTTVVRHESTSLCHYSMTEQSLVICNNLNFENVTG